MKKAMIVQPMNGLGEGQILEARTKAVAELERRGYEVDPHTRCAKHSRRVGEFASFEEYAAWLHAEYDDGTIRWDE